MHAEGETLPLDRFVLALSEEAPAAAQVSEIEIAEVSVQGFDAFEIRFPMRRNRAKLRWFRLIWQRATLV